MATFRCSNCGQKIRVNEIHAGKKGKCPKCGSVVVVPKVESIDPTTSQKGLRDSEVLKLSPPVLEVPKSDETQTLRADSDYVPGSLAEGVEKLERQSGMKELEPVPRRRFPWLIDVLLYPASTPGLTILGIIILIPLAIDFLATLLCVFSVLVVAPGFVVKLVIYFYTYWYFCRCIRDSALGGLRAPDVLVDSPDLGEMFWQTVRVVICILFFMGPMLVYFLNTKRIDTTFFILLAYAIFFFPMGLLAVVMFDSLSGLKPWLLIPSIFSTFLPYCAMVAVFFSAHYCMIEFLPRTTQSPIVSFVVRCAYLYFALVAAHVLGWFYCRYQEKLNWEA